MVNIRRFHGDGVVFWSGALWVHLDLSVRWVCLKRSGRHVFLKMTVTQGNHNKNLFKEKEEPLVGIMWIDSGFRSNGRSKEREKVQKNILI